MTVHTRSFDFCGCALNFASGDRALADWLAEDFSAFAAAGAPDPITITAVTGEVRRDRLPPAVFRTKRWEVLPSGPGRRLVWYPQGALCDYDYRARRGTLTSADPELLKELSYLLILSRAGEQLDLRGLHRLHAGALGYGGKALLFCGAQGAGKTTLLLELLKDKSFTLLSDDTPLVGAGARVHPFPARIGLAENSPHLASRPSLRRLCRRHYAPKRLLDPASAGFAVSGALPAALVFRLRRGAAARLRPAGSGQAAAELLKSLAAGAGVPQLAEYFLRADPADLLRKSGILASRLNAARSLLGAAEFYNFETGPAPAENAAALKAFLSDYARAKRWLSVPVK